MAKRPVTFTLNGAERAAFADEGQNLLDFLRRGVGDLTPKYGCGQGTCGACTVVVDGRTTLSCLVLAETVAGKRVEPAAGITEGTRLHPLQEAFMENFAAQCGYCTPGMLVSAKASNARAYATFETDALLAELDLAGLVLTEVDLDLVPFRDAEPPF